MLVEYTFCNEDAGAKWNLCFYTRFNTFGPKEKYRISMFGPTTAGRTVFMSGWAL